MATGVSVRARALFGLALALLAAACSSDAPKQGELMLSIATDMAVPNDIDRVVWSVTLDGETEPFRTETVELATGTDLPLTLAIQAGPKTTAPITIRVEGRKGELPSSLLRISREAKVVVPKDRVAKLELPLSWLCGGANLSAPCKDGTTCQAGHCVDSVVAPASLPDFQPSEEHDCYDVTACLTSATLTSVGPITLKAGREVPCGILGTKLLGPDADVNVALEVSNEQVGNYGFCGPFSECFVPLHRADTPEGWHVLDNGDTPAIELPIAVCEDAQTSITRVAVVRASPRCPSDHGDRPLCSPPQEKACLVAPVCPVTSPESAWAGYACTDAAPQDDHPDLLKCWSPEAPGSTGDTPNDGRWCCLRGLDAPEMKKERAREGFSDDPLLIDDMQAGPQIKLEPPAGHFAGWWYAEIPDGSGDLSPAPEPSLYSYRQFDEPVGPPGGPKFHAAACLSSKGFHGWLALEGFYFGSKAGTYDSDARDVSEYAGISFWGWAKEPFPDDPLAVSVSFPNVQASQEPGSECITVADGATRCDSFFEEVALTAEWKHYVVRWEDLAQTEQDWGQMHFNTFNSQIYAINFAVSGAGPDFMSQPFEFCVTDVRFEQKAEAPQ
jgi:hypothetical protein